MVPCPFFRALALNYVPHRKAVQAHLGQNPVLNARPRKPSSWPKQSIVVISSEQNIVSILRNLLTQTGWQVAGHYPTVVGAAFAVREGRANLVIADDLPEQPISGTLRFFLTNPITVCTPVLALSGHNFDTESYSLRSMGRPQVVQKPITPSRVKMGLEGLLRDWESEEMVRLRQAAYLMQKGDNQGGIVRLKQLLGSPMASPLAAQALAMLLRQIGKLKEAEALLLACLKRDATNLTVICGLVDLYLNAAMPNLAYKLLNATNTRIQPSLSMYPDLIQAALLMGEHQEAITNLHALLQSGYKPDETTHYLARVLFAMGREKEAALLLARNKGLLVRFQKAWQVADLIPLPIAG